MNRVRSSFHLICATVMVAIAPAALAQSFPAGVQGTWKITRQLHLKKASRGAATDPCPGRPLGLDPAAKGSRVVLGDRVASWGSTSAQDPDPRVTSMEPADFAGQYLHGGKIEALGLSPSAKVEVIRLNAPGTLPFDTIVVKGPSTLLFEQCGLFTEAIHAGGFVAPALPEPK